MGNRLSICSFSTLGWPNQSVALKKNEVSLTETGNDEWLKHFLGQAKSLQKKHIWAKKMANKLKSFKCPCSRQLYLVSALSISQSQTILGRQEQSYEMEEGKKTVALSNYENNSFISTLPRKQDDGVMLYKLISNLIERHLKDPQNHHLGFLLVEFTSWFYENYKKVLILENSKGLAHKSLEQSHKNAIEHLQQFIRVFVETLLLYYQIQKISNNGKLQAFSKDNFINFMTSILFANDKIYPIVFFLQKALDQTFEQKFQMIVGLKDYFEMSDYLLPKKFWSPNEVPVRRPPPLKISKKSSQNEISFFSFSSEFETPNRTFCYQDNFKRPAEFESFHSFQHEEEELTPEKFSSFDDLNKATSQGKRSIDLLRELSSPLEDRKSSNEERKNQYGAKSPATNYHYKRRTPRKSETPKANTSRTIVEFVLPVTKSKPYAEPIRILEEMGELRSPIHKMKRILLIISHIMRSLSNYADGTLESETLDQRHLFCLLLYIVMQSKCSDLHSQLKIIEKFSTNNVLASVSGYYFTMLQLVVKFIGELDTVLLMGDDKKEYLKDRLEEILFNLKRHILF